MSITIVTPLPSRAHDLAGQRKQTWTIVRFHGSDRGATKWVARCDCGAEKIVRAGNWRHDKGLSCACQPKRQNYNQLPFGEASFNMLFDGYVRKARSRGLDFTLSREEFRALTKSDCLYCGRPPSQTRKTGSGTPYL